MLEFILKSQLLKSTQFLLEYSSTSSLPKKLILKSTSTQYDPLVRTETSKKE